MHCAKKLDKTNYSRSADFLPIIPRLLGPQGN